MLVRKLLEIKDYELVNMHWAKMSLEQKEQIKHICLAIFVSEADKSIKTNVSDIINEVANNVYESNEKWDELVSLILTSFSLDLNNENLPVIEGALNLLAGIFGFVYDQVTLHMTAITDTFRRYFQTGVLSLKTRTARTVAEMISMADKKESAMLKEFIMNILETTLKCFEDEKEENNVITC